MLYCVVWVEQPGADDPYVSPHTITEHFPLEECIESVQKDSTYRNFEIVIVENNSEGEDIWEYYKEAVQKYDNIRILYYKVTT